MGDPHYYTVIDSPFGELRLVASDHGLRAVLWPDDQGRVSLPDQQVRDDSNPTLVASAAQLDEYFRGERRHFDLPLDLRGTDFQRAAWSALADIPYGMTSTYREQAERIGRPTATRAVGAANGKNPISIVLPCHRVVGTNGKLTGFAAGLDAKRRLLDLEQFSS